MKTTKNISQSGQEGYSYSSNDGAYNSVNANIEDKAALPTMQQAQDLSKNAGSWLKSHPIATFSLAVGTGAVVAKLLHSHFSHKDM